MNVPGRATGNWTWRCSEEMLFTADFHSLLELTKSSNRIEPSRFASKKNYEAA
jgi:hypothetical protein